MKKMSFKSGVKGPGVTDGESEGVDCDEVTHAGRGELGGE